MRHQMQLFDDDFLFNLNPEKAERPFDESLETLLHNWDIASDGTLIKRSLEPYTPAWLDTALDMR